jgi:hypothetical protein
MPISGRPPLPPSSTQEHTQPAEQGTDHNSDAGGQSRSLCCAEAGTVWVGAVDEIVTVVVDTVVAELIAAAVLRTGGEQRGPSSRYRVALLKFLDQEGLRLCAALKAAGRECQGCDD